MKGLMICAAAAALLALAGCAGRPADQRAILTVTMTGIQEVPGPGDPDGSGTAEIRVDPRDGQVCWNLYARGIDPATAAHIHRGAAGIAGPPVVTLTTPDAAGRSQGCADGRPGPGARDRDARATISTSTSTPRRTRPARSAASCAAGLGAARARGAGLRQRGPGLR